MYNLTTILLVSIISLFSLQAPILAAPTGYDYNLTKRCVKSVDPHDPNHYQDTSQCEDSGNWTIAIQSESELGSSCVGNNNHSFPINSPSSPVSVDWLINNVVSDDSPWQVKLTTDLSQLQHPCGGGAFNWFVLMDHVGHGGGPLSNPNNISTSAKIQLSSNLNPNSAALRSFVAFQGFWNNTSYGIELNYYTSPNWGDAHTDPAIIQTAQTDTYHFFSLDGRAFDIYYQIGDESTIYINWIDIINYLASKGYISPPNDWGDSSTGAVYVGTEYNNFSSLGGGQALLLLSNFRNSTTQVKAGDLNQDGHVNIFDFNLLVANFGNPYTIFDFNIVVANFGK